jgi:3-deoxy-D-manno-octulosonic acid kinase
VVRPFRRGGLVRHLVEARYFLGDRAFHELALLARLRRRDLPVPRPLAAVQSRRIPGYRAALTTRRIPGVEPLSRLLPGSPPDRTRRLMEAAGRTVGRLHAVGAAHADLNAHNLLADPEPSDRPVYLVDLDRGRLGDPPLPERAARGNLRRLRRSLEKLSLEGALDHWDGFLRSYRRNREGTAGGSTG